MRIKQRLIIMFFLQFFIWGAWLMTIGSYWFHNKHWSPSAFGSVFSTMGIASLFMPIVAGVIADRWIRAEKLLAFFHLMGAIILLTIPTIHSPQLFFWVLLLNMVFYMPTISLSITVAYNALNKYKMDTVKEYPSIRVFGTIGFIVAMWIVSLLKIETSSTQFYIASGASFILGIYAFTLPKCDIVNIKNKISWSHRLGLNAFSLFKTRKMAIFFIFSMFLGASLQLTNMYADSFLHDFSKIPVFKDILAVKYPAIILSISQFSEMFFILTIPFFLQRFGIKKVMLISMLAWVARFALLGFSNPAEGLWMIILSGIVYGMAFDFFNISGSLYIEIETDENMRASAQGLFMMMTNGLGAILGSWGSGLMIEVFFKNTSGHFYWQEIWSTFALYSLIITILFMIFFKYKHQTH